jgi:hypothetical protein
MADPLSILAGLAGVATAGVTISICLYDMAHTIKNAPKQIRATAQELSLLSSVLRSLRGAIRDSRDVCKPRLIKDLKDVLRRIRSLYRDIKSMAEASTSSMYRLKALFTSSKTEALLKKVAAFKSTIHLILGTVQLAAIQKRGIV